MNDGSAPVTPYEPSPPCEVCGRGCYWYERAGPVWCVVCQWWAQLADRGPEAVNRVAKALGVPRGERKRAGLA